MTCVTMPFGPRIPPDMIVPALHDSPGKVMRIYAPSRSEFMSGLGGATSMARR